jgi:hypothetical protein
MMSNDILDALDAMIAAIDVRTGGAPLGSAAGNAQTAVANEGKTRLSAGLSPVWAFWALGVSKKGTLWRPMQIGRKRKLVHLWLQYPRLSTGGVQGFALRIR